MDRIEPDKFRTIGAVAADIVAGLRDEVTYTGGTITQAGIYAGVPMEAYHRKPDLFDGWSMSSSGLRAVLRRPSEYWMGSPFNPNPEPDESTKALNFGKAAHALLLGDEDFKAHYVLRPAEIEGKPWQGNRTPCKEWIERQTSAGLTVVTEDDIERIKRIADAMHRHPVVSMGLLSGRAERTMCTKRGGLWIKARPDAIPDADGLFSDLKTAADVSDEGINRALAGSGYHVQAATIRMVAMSIGLPFTDFAFIFVEKAPPYDVRVKVLKAHDLDRGQQLVEVACAITERCIKEGRWPGFDGFGNAEGYAEVPTWAAGRETQLIEIAKAERIAA